MNGLYHLVNLIRRLEPVLQMQSGSIDALARRIRWQDGVQGRMAGPATELPAGPISVNGLAERILSPNTVPLRLLSYNTYLLPGSPIPFGKWLDDAVGWNALEWFGLHDGAVILAGLGLVSLPGVALATVLETAGLTPSMVIHKLTQIDLNTVVSPGAKPALDARAPIVGTVAGDYDLCCLCEVWALDTQQKVAAHLADQSGQPFNYTVGPDAAGAYTILGSGLFFAARQKWPIVKTEKLVYDNLGERRKDSDSWSRKGAMLNVIDLGFGQLELFQTHLYYGGGLKDYLPFPGIADPTPEERLAVQRAELEQLAAFYRAHHQPHNLALLTGDFNMSGSNPLHYGQILDVLGGLGLQDLWAWDVYGHHPSAGVTCRFTDGSRANWETSFINVCTAQPQLGRDEPWADVCDEREQYPPPHAGTGRYDYLFVAAPSPEHRYTLEVSRVLRRPFPLHTFDGNFEGEQTLSDHIGLEVTLFLTPR